MITDTFTELVNNPNPVISILASLNIILSGVVVYQWRYTMKNTVPKWIWDEFTGKIDDMIKMQIAIKERLGRK